MQDTFSSKNYRKHSRTPSLQNQIWEKGFLKDAEATTTPFCYILFKKTQD